MSIHDDEIEYQQWREEKEDWEMMQEENGFVPLDQAGSLQAALDDATTRLESAMKYEAAYKALRKMVRDLPELNMKNYTEDEVARLNHDAILMELFCQEVDRT